MVPDVANAPHIEAGARQLWMVDLCCGLKGASAPARDRGWRVTTLDILEWLRPDVVGLIEELPFKRGCAPDLLWVSPECTTYTRVRLPWFPDREPDITLMAAAVAAVELLAPRGWVIENVPAAITWCAPFLGAPAAKVHAHAFWSDLFALLPRVRPHKVMIPGYCWDTHWRRSIIPYEVAHAFVIAAEYRAAQSGSKEVPL